MKTKFLAGLAVTTALLAAASANAASSYSTSYVALANNAASGSVNGSGDTGATIYVGDSLTVTFAAPTGLSFKTSGDDMFVFQMLSALDQITENATYTFYNGNAVVDSGSATDVSDVCCVDLRVPVFTSPAGSWDRLVYTVTVTAESSPAVLANALSYSLDGATYVSSVPEASNAALLLAGLGLLGATARRRKA